MSSRRSLSATPATPAATPAVRQRVRRGSAADHEELRQRILAAAFAIHEREGIAAMSMRALATEVGLSPMALYRYFSGKAQLLRALGEVAMADVEAEVTAATADLPTARERLRASADTFIAYWEARPDRFRLLYMTPETMQPEAVPEPLASPQYESSVGLAMRLNLDFIAEVGGDRKRAVLARDLLTALMVGYLHSRIVNTRYPWGDFKALRRAVIDTIMAGVEQSVRKAK